jgi:hypothetical protein
MATPKDAKPTRRRGRWRLALYIASGLVAALAIATYASTDRLRAFGGSPEMLTVEAARRGASILTPLLGEPVEPTSNPTTTAWWRAFPPMAASCP